MVTDDIALGIQIGGTFLATLAGVLIAFWLRARSQRKRDLRDMLYIPAREVSHAVKEQLAKGGEVETIGIGDLHRTTLSRGLSQEGIYEHISKLVTGASLYNEQLHYFRAKVDQVLEEHLGDPASWEDGLRRLMSPRDGRPQTAKSFLYDPGRYTSPLIVTHWWGSFASVAVASGKFKEPGTLLEKEEEGDTPKKIEGDTIMSWGDTSYVLDPDIKIIGDEVHKALRESAALDNLSYFYVELGTVADRIITEGKTWLAENGFSGP